MLRPRRRIAALVLGAALLFTVGTSVQAGWLLVLSSILLGAAIAGLLLPLRMVRGVKVQRRAPEEAFQGELVSVELTVSNSGRGMRLGLEIQDPHLSRTRILVPPLGPGDRAVIGTTRKAARRGSQEATAASVRSAAPFGVAQARRSVAAAGRTLVYPAVIELGWVPLIDLAPTHDSAMHTAPRRGTGPEYLGIREYRTGDSMRHVHWPSTARLGQVMVREFEQEHTRRLAIVVDTWADAGEEDTPLDAACSVAASVAFAAFGRGHGIRLVAGRGGSLDALIRAEPRGMLAWLADLPAFGGIPLANVVAQLGGHLRGIHTVLLAVPTWRANAGIADVVGALRSEAGPVAVVMIESHTFPSDRRAPVLSPSEIDRLAADLASRGVTVYRLRSGLDLAECLRQPFPLAS